MVTAGLIRQSTYAEVAAEVELDSFRKNVRLPDRAAKFTLESLELQQISPQNEQDIIAFERRKQEQEARKQEIDKVAQERGVSRAILHQSTRSGPEIPTINVHDNDFDERRYANSLQQSTANWMAATQGLESTRRLAAELRQSLGEAHLQQPHVRVGGSRGPEIYDIASAPTTPRAIDLHTPAVPSAGERAAAAADDTRMMYETVAGGGQLVRSAGGATGQLVMAAGGAALRNAPAAIETVQEVARIVQMYGPDVARTTMQAAGVSAEALRMILSGIARGTLATGSALTNVVSATGHVLAAAAPVHRNTDYQRAMGVQFVGRVASGMLARHATALL